MNFSLSLLLIRPMSLSQLLHHHQLVLLLLLLSLCWHPSRVNGYGLQTGPDKRGSTYGGALIYNPNTNLIYVTGATYGSFFQNEHHVADSTNNKNQSASLSEVNTTNAITSACFLGMVQGPNDNSMTTIPEWLFTSTFQSNPTQSISDVRERLR